MLTGTMQIRGMRELIPIAGTAVILVTGISMVQRATPQDEQLNRAPLAPPCVVRNNYHDPSDCALRRGAAITAPNIGVEGTLDVLDGGGSPRVWSFDIFSGTWQALANAPGPVRSGGAISNLFNDCDFAFEGGGSKKFFSTGTICN